MDDIPFYKRAWFYIAAWLAILLVAYGWQISRMGGFVASEVDIFIDLVCIFPALLLLWMAFFAQFVLPVRTFADRQKIFNRLITYLLGGHGPALFIENGKIQEHSGERLKKGPGVLWLDSASAALIRTPVAIKRTIGPGVHFTEGKEFIGGTVDLHKQSQTLGPMEEDKPFEEKKEEQTKEAYDQIQDRRKQVSALTRDGIEVIPNISVTFRVNTGFPKEGKPGSRFGYRIRTTERDKWMEEDDKEAIKKAILGEGINPNVQPDSPRHRVAWNQLPAVLAVDVWREYVGKFTLDELFKADKLLEPPPLQPPQPTEEEIDLLSQPLQVSGSRETFQDAIASMLHVINVWMDRLIRLLEGKKENKPQKTAPVPSTSFSPKKREFQKKTALQIINEMVKARLTQEEVQTLDKNGHPVDGTKPSPEYALLQRRGIKVLDVGIVGLRLNPKIEEQLIKQWKATWLYNAKLESEQIDRKRNIIEATAQEKAIREYAIVLSHEISKLAKKESPSVKGALKALLMRSRSLILSREQLRRRMNTELQDIEAMIKWIDVNCS